MLPICKEQPSIFISYRRDDLDTAALRIKQRLDAVFGEGAVFLDVDIDYGAPWPQRIRAALQGARVVLALIGPRWFEVQNEFGARRIDRKQDWVRRELEEALERNIKIIPVVFDGLKQFEAAEAYPEDSVLVRIKDFKKFDILKSYFDDHLDILIRKQLLPLLGPAQGFEEKMEAAGEPFDPLRDLPLPAALAGKMPEEEAPYIGLRPFEKEDALLFHGRGQQILELYHKIQDHRVTLLYGYSGVGKSSLLFAGLFPRIEHRWTIRYIRRDFQTGLDHQLAQALRRIRRENEGPYLLMLDQAEEMFTAPNPSLLKEAQNFGKEISNAVDAYEDIRFIIGYRSDYYVQMDELLRPHRLPKGEYLLRPLDRQGILAAINGVPDSPLNDTYKVVIEDGIDMQIAEQLSRDVSSAVGPLLQVQLRLLWDAGTGRRKADYEEVRFTTALLEEHFNKNLENFLQSQLSKLRGGPWEEALEMGLVLDLLHFYTTERYTAASRTDADLEARYEDTPTRNLLIELKKLYLLAGDPASKTKATRLAHDALAPVVRDRFNDSNRPAQQAWRILEAKRYDPDANFSDSDIRTIHSGRAFMPRIQPELLARIEADEAELLHRAQLLRENQEFIFQRLTFDAREAIRSVDHADAPDKFEAALRFDFSHEAKKEELLTGLLELLFFFNEAQDEAMGRDTVEQLLYLLRDQPEIRTALEACKQTGDSELIREFFEQHFPEEYRVFESRYYPVMIEVEGGQYERGGGDFAEENPAHPVAVKSFRLAHTPCTFYQYSLFCYLAGIKVAGHSPPWGRHGEHPLVLISWYAAVEYANWLSEHLGLTPAYAIDRENQDPFNQQEFDNEKWTVEPVQGANGFRLPTEAEWEWAARGGKKGKGYPFAGAGNPAETVWSKENSPDGTQPVASLSPNELGLFDMCGNVWEWCWDWYHEQHYASCKEKGLLENPTGPEQGGFRALRGGSYYNKSSICKITVRVRNYPIRSGAMK